MGICVLYGRITLRPYIIDNHDDVSAFLIILYSLVARIAVRVGPLVARTAPASDRLSPARAVRP